MNIKRKLLSGSMTAVMGIALIGGGTWAAFNDVETVSSTVEAGTLDLGVNKTVVFDIHNLKPSDTMVRDFTITNVGLLDIDKVLMHTSFEVLDKAGNPVTGSDANEYAKQFKVHLLKNGIKNLPDGLNKTVYDLKTKTDSAQSADLTNYLLTTSLTVGNTNTINIGITFLDDATKTGKLYNQNKYQGWTLKVKFNLEATQFAGFAR